MNGHPEVSPKITIWSAKIAFFFFIPAVGLMPGPGSSLGMPWPVFFATWGICLSASCISLIGYLKCRKKVKRLSAFYAICPLLIFMGFLLAANLREIIRWWVSM